MKKQYNSSIIKNHKITNKQLFDGVPLKGYVASEVILDFAPEIKKKKKQEGHHGPCIAPLADT